MFRLKVIFILIAALFIRTTSSTSSTSFHSIVNNISNVNFISTSNFSKLLRQKEKTIVVFVAPWCGISKNFLIDLKLHVNNKSNALDYSLLLVDSVKETELYDSYNIHTFPTAYLFEYGVKTNVYHAQSKDDWTSDQMKEFYKHHDDDSNGNIRKLVWGNNDISQLSYPEDIYKEINFAGLWSPSMEEEEEGEEGEEGDAEHRKIKDDVLSALLMPTIARTIATTAKNDQRNEILFNNESSSKVSKEEKEKRTHIKDQLISSFVTPLVFSYFPFNGSTDENNNYEKLIFNNYKNDSKTSFILTSMSHELKHCHFVSLTNIRRVIELLETLTAQERRLYNITTTITQYVEAKKKPFYFLMLPKAWYGEQTIFPSDIDDTATDVTGDFAAAVDDGGDNDNDHHTNPWIINKQNILQTKMILIPNDIHFKEDLMKFILYNTWPSVIKYNNYNKRVYLRNTNRPSYLKHLLFFPGPKLHYTKYMKMMSNVCNQKEWKSFLSCKGPTILLLLIVTFRTNLPLFLCNGHVLRYYCTNQRTLQI